MKELIVAGTGHRPPRLGGYSAELDARLFKLAKWALLKLGATKVISGMAQGWDKQLALAAIALDIPFIAAVPFEGQENRWPHQHQEEFRALLAKAERVEVVCPGPYANWKFLKRDEWMVDEGQRLLALWDGQKDGGTWHTVQYARAIGRPVSNVWNRFSRGA